eukprot:8713460-Ditylum_brightwellii.AAC.1
MEADQSWERLFRHMNNLAAQTKWDKTKRKTGGCYNRFNYARYKGDGMKKKLAAWRLNNIDA